MNPYARCAVCDYEYPAQISVTMTKECPKCSTTFAPLNPAEDEIVPLHKSWFWPLCDDVKRWAAILSKRDPLAFSCAPAAAKAIVSRIKAQWRTADQCPIKLNWAELIFLMRWAEQYSMGEIQAKRRDFTALQKVVAYAREIEDLFPRRRKLTDVTLQAEAAIQEKLVARPKLPGVKWRQKDGHYEKD